MKELPILFNGPMVQALLGGRKTQTRRPVLKKRAIPGEPRHYTPDFGLDQFVRVADCPYGVPGDHLWVRETIRCEPEDVYYLADGMSIRIDDIEPEQERWIQDYGNRSGESHTIPSIHMPRWASRITLEVTGVRVECVQDISEEDAKAEGVACMKWINFPEAEPNYRVFFWALWDKLYAKNGLGWDVNPWVWVVEFKAL